MPAWQNGGGVGGGGEGGGGGDASSPPPPPLPASARRRSIAASRLATELVPKPVTISSTVPSGESTTKRGRLEVNQSLPVLSLSSSSTTASSP